MKRLHFIHGLLISTLSLAAAACSSSSSSGPAGSGDSSTGGSTSGAGGSTSSSGGSTSGTGGSTSGTGGSTSGKDGGANPCAEYCTKSLSLCTGANKQFDSNSACLTACAAFPTTGTDGASSGNTLQCRMTHLGLILQPADAATHCGHTGVTPTAFCK